MHSVHFKLSTFVLFYANAVSAESENLILKAEPQNSCMFSSEAGFGVHDEYFILFNQRNCLFFILKISFWPRLQLLLLYALINVFSTAFVSAS